MQKIAILVAIILLHAVGFYVLYTYVLISDETRIRRVIEKGRKAIEEESLLTAATLIADNYRDEYGQDRGTVLGGLRSLFQSTENLQIDIHSTEITVDNEDAEAVVTFSLSGEHGGHSFRDIAPDRKTGGSVYFAKGDGGWKVAGTSRFRPLPD